MKYYNVLYGRIYPRWYIRFLLKFQRGVHHDGYRWKRLFGTQYLLDIEGTE